MLRLYKTPSLRSEYSISKVSEALAFYCDKYDNILLMRNFKLTPENPHLKDFTNSNDSENLISQLALKAILEPPLTSFWQTPFDKKVVS